MTLVAAKVTHRSLIVRLCAADKYGYHESRAIRHARIGRPDACSPRELARAAAAARESVLGIRPRCYVRTHGPRRRPTISRRALRRTSAPDRVWNGFVRFSSGGARNAPP